MLRPNMGWEKTVVASDKRKMARPLGGGVGGRGLGHWGGGVGGARAGPLGRAGVTRSTTDTTF